MLRKHICCAAVSFTLALAACSSGSGNGDGGTSSAGTTGGASSGYTPVNEGDVCTGTAGQQANCPQTTEICTPYSSGATVDICRVTCTANTDCTVPGETCQSVSGSTCACTATPTDSCNAANSNTLCHPDYAVCVTKGSSTPTDCGPGECADPVLFICRPDGLCNGAPDGGMDAGMSCGSDDTEGTCTWPDYCLTMACTLPQNVSAAGADAPSMACQTPSSSMQGSGNLDSDRATNGQETFAANSPIITDLEQVMVAGSDATCAMYIGTGATADSSSANVCNGGTSDAMGRSICASGEVAVLFTGHAIDPQSLFQTSEGASLDGQFWRLSANGSGNPVQLTATGSSVGAAITGYIIPGTGWAAGGGPFVLARCLGSGGGNYPAIMTNYPVTDHFADTGVAGNSYCGTWTP